MCTINFLLSTVHVGASLQQLLDAFVYAPTDVPDYSTTYWLNLSVPPRPLKDVVFVTLVCNPFILSVQLRRAQRNTEGRHPLLHPGKFGGHDGVDTEIHTCHYEIWRLFVVFLYDWRVVIFPVGNQSSSSSAFLLRLCDRAYSRLVLRVCSPFNSCLTHSDTSLGPGYAAVSAFSNGLHNSRTTTLIIVAWALGCTLNLSITVTIVARLWRMNRTIASLTATSSNRFGSTIHAIIESGAIATACSIAVLALFVSSSPFALPALDVFSQVTVGIYLSYLLRALSRSVFAGITSTFNRRAGCDNWSVSLSRHWFLEDDTCSAG